VGRKTVIGEAKEKVATIALARLLCSPGELRKSGKEWLARCPLPNHEDRMPSFTVTPEKNLWFCHGCVRGGDVVDLARHAWGYPKAEVAMAAAQLLHEFGHEIPRRSSSWFARQERQYPARSAIKEAQLRHLTRRVYRRAFLPFVARIEDQSERREERELLWECAKEIALLMLADRSPA
jgi:hypothetical protein